MIWPEGVASKSFICCHTTLCRKWVAAHQSSSSPVLYLLLEYLVQLHVSASRTWTNWRSAYNSTCIVLYHWEQHVGEYKGLLIDNNCLLSLMTICDIGVLFTDTDILLTRTSCFATPDDIVRSRCMYMKISRCDQLLWVEFHCYLHAYTDSGYQVLSLLSSAWNPAQL